MPSDKVLVRVHLTDGEDQILREVARQVGVNRAELIQLAVQDCLQAWRGDPAKLGAGLRSLKQTLDAARRRS